MKILTNTITILAEIAALIVTIIWYITTKELEPVVGIIISASSFVTSMTIKLTNRPRIVLHNISTDYGRGPQGYTANNPPIIIVGVDNPEMYWRLTWNHILEIRNNSSFVAYNIKVNYINLPEKTQVEGEFGKIEPFQPNELKQFRVKFVQNVTGTHIDADKYLNDNPAILTDKFKIRITYTDEAGIVYSTIYEWVKDKNKYGIFY